MQSKCGNFNWFEGGIGCEDDNINETWLQYDQIPTMALSPCAKNCIDAIGPLQIPIIDPNPNLKSFTKMIIFHYKTIQGQIPQPQFC
jgi:hypothetical protein